jgi:GxxExxY protein
LQKCSLMSSGRSDEPSSNFRSSDSDHCVSPLQFPLCSSVSSVFQEVRAGNAENKELRRGIKWHLVARNGTGVPRFRPILSAMPSSLHAPIPASINLTSGIVVDAAMVVHTTFGPGLLESAYRRCLVLELRSRGMRVDVEVPITIAYRGKIIEEGYRGDLVVNEEVIVEVKAIARLLPIHHAQVMTYLRLSRRRVANPHQLQRRSPERRHHSLCRVVPPCTFASSVFQCGKSWKPRGQRTRVPTRGHWVESAPSRRCGSRRHRALSARP